MQILIFHRGSLGDFILIWPTLMAIKTYYVFCEIIGLGRGEYMELALKVGLIDRFHSMESDIMVPFIAGKSIPESFKNLTYALLWMKNGNSMEKIIQLSNKSAKILLIEPFANGNKHLSRYYLNTISNFFDKPQITSSQFSLPIHLGKSPNNVVLHPGSGSPSKNFDIKLYLSIAHQINRFNLDITFLIGPADEYLINDIKNYSLNTSTTTVYKLFLYLKECKLFIGNDSGVSHLASIMGIPCITLFKTTDPLIWGPVGPKTNIIHSSEELIIISKIEHLLKKGNY